jgi:polar amino acid transport system substrate-binding protein
MSERRERHGLRGWGGVAAMATACVLAVSATVLPLQARADASAGQAGRDTPLTTAPLLTSATGDCDDDHPEDSLTPSAASGPAVERIRKAGKLVVGVDQNSYRWGYRDPDSGDIVGFDIDLVKAIAKDILGDENAVQYKTVPTKKRFEAIRKRQVDMVVRTVTINCDRIDKEQVAFSTAYFQAGQQLLVPHEGSTITDFNDTLKGKKVCTAAGSTGETTLEKNRHGSRLVLVDNQLDCLVKLQLGEVDAVFTDNALAAGQAAQDPAVHLVGKPATQEYYGVAMNDKDTDLVRRVNKVLEDYRSGGSASAWEKAYGTWLKAVLPGIDGPPTPRYKSG